MLNDFWQKTIGFFSGIKEQDNPEEEESLDEQDSNEDIASTDDNPEEVESQEAEEAQVAVGCQPKTLPARPLEVQTSEQQISPPPSKPQPPAPRKNYLFRPKTFDEFVDNEKVKDRLKIAVQAAKKRNSVPGHLILSGAAGTGKTTVSQIVANEFDAELVTTVGSSIQSQKDILELMWKIRIIQEIMKKKAILFIDEVHELAGSKDCPQTLFYPILEEYIFYHNLKGNEKIKLRHPLLEGEYYPSDDIFILEPFTIIGATTHSGLLSKPLRDRFQLSCLIQPYRAEDIKTIVLRYCQRASLGITQEAAEIISERTRGNPRCAINACISCRDRMLVKDLKRISKQIVLEQFDSEGIDNMGLSEDDYKILVALAESSRGLGLKNLSGTVGIAAVTIENQLEDFLKYLKLMKVTSRRMITDKGIELLEQKGLFVKKTTEGVKDEKK